MKDKTPLCIFTSDIHLTHRKYTCRKEKDWYVYQRDILDWLSDLCEQEAVPLVAVGDIFDRPNHPPELINMAIDHMPYCLVTSGNHDNYWNNKELQHKSAYGTFIRSDKATELNKVYKLSDNINLHPYHFGELSGTCNKEDGSFNIALIHELVWEGSSPFEGAPKSGNVEELVKRFQGFDMIVCGDMHEFFSTKVGDTVILNNGSLMRITAGQKDYQPKVHLLYSDGSIEHIDVPVDDDLISTEHLDTKKEVKKKIDGFVTNLQKSDEKEQLSFEDRIRECIIINDINVEVKEIIMEEMENG